MKASAASERIVPRLIEEELRDSFIDYSMSVIVQRALPDARDGLKPVHRRILYAMYEMGLFPDRDYKKSATVVGDVLGKYHPHGDSAVYDTLVRMVQKFSLRYPLIDGQGNFGSIDGDSAAAYRYTEARLAPISLELLADIEEDTVDFLPNFDGRLKEPRELPARLPHLLLNGTDGIAVGMATKIPPHNLRELVAACDHLIRHPDCAVEDLMNLVEGPDFPTYGYIWGYGGIGDAYRTGRGLIEMRARLHVEEGSYGKQTLVVTELPYQVNKARVIEQITRVVRSGRLAAVSDLRDESDRDGIRLLIELKKGADPRQVLNTLFLKTQLRTTYGVIMLALVEGRPQQLNLKQALECFVDHRLSVIRRRALFQLTRCEERVHVLEGLLLALDQLDRVIELIRSSDTPATAARRLQADLELSETQAQAILAMRLARLTGLESEKLHGEAGTLRIRIEELTRLVAEDALRRSSLREELADQAARFGDERRTQVLDESEQFPLPLGGSAEAALVWITRRGYVKSLPVRSGVGLAAGEALAERDGDFVRQAFVCRGSGTLLAFTESGRVFGLAMQAVPHGTRSSRGHLLADLAGLPAEDPLVALIAIQDFDREGFILTATEGGQVKKTRLQEYANTRAGGIRSMGLAGGDRVLCVLLTDGSQDVVLATRHGMAIRFPESEIRAMGRSAKGVRGLELATGDQVTAALAPRRDSDLGVITSGGFGKRVPVHDLRVQRRAGKGLRLLPERASAGDLTNLLEINPGDLLMCEMDDGEAVMVEAWGLPAGSRRDPSVRVREITRRGGSVVAVHPLRHTLKPGDPAAAELQPVDDLRVVAPGAVEAGPVDRGLLEPEGGEPERDPIRQGELDLLAE